MKRKSTSILKRLAIGPLVKWIIIAAISFLAGLAAAQKAGAAVVPPVVPINECLLDDGEDLALPTDCIVCIPVCAIDASGVACATCLAICLATPT